MTNNSESPTVVTLFVPTLAGGGAERVMIMLANELAQYGDRVDLVTGNATGPYGHLISNKVNLIDFQAQRLIFALPSLAKYLWKTKPKAALSALNHANTAMVVLAKFLSPRTRVVISVHNSLRIATPRKRAKLTTQLLRYRRRWVFLNAEHIVTVSNGIRKQIHKNYQIELDRITAIYNPVDYVKIAEIAQEPTQNNWLDEDSIPVILGIGSLTKQKNFELLIRSFALVVGETPARLVILGEGEQRAHLESIIRELKLENDILMPGFVANPFAWLSKSAVFVLSSDWEGLPGVVLEALACGTQVVATDCETGPKEILDNGKWGTLVEVGNKAELARSIVNSLHADSLIDTKARAADFSLSKSVEAYRAMLLPGEV